jgi:hypothetical protein
MVVGCCKPRHIIEGHTEINGQPAGDDGDYCFKRDDSRDLVLTVKAPEIKKDKTVFPLLIDLLKGPVEEKPVIVTTDGMATITYHGHPDDRENKEHRARPFHLGPGPYVATATMALQSASGQKGESIGSQPLILTYPYVTYVSNKSECPPTGSHD